MLQHLYESCGLDYRVILFIAVKLINPNSSSPTAGLLCGRNYD